MTSLAIEELADLEIAEIERVIASLKDDQVFDAEDDFFGNWAHAGQDEPTGDHWRTWVIKGGRGFGKTRSGAEWIAAQARAHPGARIALVAATREEARAIMVEGESGLLSVAGHELSAWLPSLHQLRWINGARAALFSGAKPDMLRGAEHHFAWCDELAKWDYPRETWEMLQLTLRKGALPRTVVTTTPQTGRYLEEIIALADTETTGGPTRRNVHTSARWQADIHKMYKGTRLEKQELEGELLPGARFALWSAELIEACRINPVTPAQAGACSAVHAIDGEANGAEAPACAGVTGGFTKLHIGVDPPIEDGTCGIVACAMTQDGTGVKTGYVLADHSVTGRSPEGWARAVADAVRIHEAATGLSVKVIAERNQGGRMVEANLRAADANLRVKLVHAREGKVARAAPVAHLFEAGRVKLAGHFPELEAELRQFKAGGTETHKRWHGPDGRAASPDRADAMVWALTDLMLGEEKGVPRIRQL